MTLALLMLAFLAPGIARALSFAKGDAAPWGLICFASAQKRSGDVPGALALHGLESCALCTAATDAPPLPSAPLRMIEPPTLGVALPAQFLHAPHTLFAWRSAQARAPPLSS